MDARRLRWLAEESAAWVKAGLIDATGRNAILARYPEDAVRPSLAMRTFYALGGVLLGAAVFALWAFMGIQGWIDDDAEAFAWWFFATFAATWGAAAIIFHHVRGDADLGMTFSLAALVNAVALMAPDPGPDALMAAAPLAAAGLFVWRIRDDLVPMAALLAFHITLPSVLIRWFNDDTAAFVWLALALPASAALLYVTRRTRFRWHHLGLAIGAGGFIASWIAMVAEELDGHWHIEGSMEILVAFGLIATLATGILAREPALLYVGGLGLTIDAVVFAFDVGGVDWGLATLVVLSGGLIGLATWLRRRQKGAVASESP